MIVKNIQNIYGTDFEVSTAQWVSHRLLLEHDCMGFSMHDTKIYAGETLEMHYKHHQEAVYCIEGEGILHDLTNHKTYSITPGTLYALDGHEKHTLIAKTQMRMICVFNPALIGQEVHLPDGSYPLPAKA
jgi:L-ectoine synthase